jgi:hypothetical protein
MQDPIQPLTDNYQKANCGHHQSTIENTQYYQKAKSLDPQLLNTNLEIFHGQ